MYRVCVSDAFLSLQNKNCGVDNFMGSAGFRFLGNLLVKTLCCQSDSLKLAARKYHIWVNFQDLLEVLSLINNG